jgi:hypothetical protein
MHFLVAGLALLKAAVAAHEVPFIWPVALLYAGFAVAFGVILFRHPIREADAGQTTGRANNALRGTKSGP